MINRFTYPVLKLWEYEEEIWAGKWLPLVPLLTLIARERDERVLARERELIMQEPNEKKRCAVSRTERIATRGGRSSGQMTPRRTTYLDPKGKGDKSMSRLFTVGVKRGTPEDVYGVALQHLSDMVKAGLPEPVRHVTAKLNRVQRTP